jgi:RNA polymerase sigma-70 factor, ECF subfamily
MELTPVTRMRTFDRLEFRQIYDTYVQRVQRKMMLMAGLRNRAQVDDWVQETFVTVYQHLPEFRGECALSTWIFRIAINVALQHIRKQGSLARLLERFVRNGEREHPRSPEQQVAGSEHYVAAQAVLERLAPEQRVVFVLYEVEEHTLPEIAAITGASPNTVASRLRLARERVATHLRDTGASAFSSREPS